MITGAIIWNSSRAALARHCALKPSPVFEFPSGPFDIAGEFVMEKPQSI